MHTQNYRITLCLTLIGLSYTLCAMDQEDSAAKRPHPDEKDHRKNQFLIALNPGDDAFLHFTCVAKTTVPNVYLVTQEDDEETEELDKIIDNQQGLAARYLGCPDQTRIWPPESAANFSMKLAEQFDSQGDLKKLYVEKPVSQLLKHLRKKCTSCMEQKYCFLQTRKKSPSLQKAHNRLLWIFTQLGLSNKGDADGTTPMPTIGMLLCAKEEARVSRGQSIPTELKVAATLLPVSRPLITIFCTKFSKSIEVMLRRYLEQSEPSSWFENEYVLLPPWAYNPASDEKTDSDDEAGSSGVHH